MPLIRLPFSRRAAASGALLVALAAPISAQAPAATPTPPTEATAPAAATPAPAATPKLRPWQRQKGPPDGKWLVDERGREYYVKKFPKPPDERAYMRTGPNSVRLPTGMDLEIVGEDAEFFFGKIFRVDNIETKVTRMKDDPTPEQLAAKAVEYAFATPASDRIRFAPIGSGLPTEGQWRNGLDLDDVDRDGRLDILFGGTRRSMNSVPHLFRGDGKGEFKLWEAARYPRLPYDYGDIAAGDFNQDGRRDLAIAVHLRGLVALFGDGKGGFTLASTGLRFEAGQLRPGQVSLFSSRALAAVDWDGDGADEILALAEGPMGTFASQKGMTNRLQESYGVVLYRYGAEGWEALPLGTTHPELFGDSIATGDFNADGKPDFVTGSNARGNAAIVHLQKEGGSWSYTWIDGLRKRSYTNAVTAGDFDGDGRDDFAVGYQSIELEVWRTGVDLFLSRADGSFERRTVYNEPGKAGFFALAAGDLDGDRRLDFATGTGDGRVFVFLGDGQGGFTSEDALELASEKTCRVYDLGIADFDRDKRQDLVLGFAGEECPGGGRLAAWRSVAPR